MCLTFFCLHPSANCSFIMCFNRDEQVVRPTLAFAPYQQDPNIIGGRDLKSKGTWLGLNIHTGILVFLTNYDTPTPHIGASRGKLVLRLLQSNLPPAALQQTLNDILTKRQKYSPFNLVAINLRSDEAFYICSMLDTVIHLEMQKHYGLCNADIFTMWPKTKHGLQLFKEAITKEQPFTHLQQLCKDKVAFSQQPHHQSSIFITPYFNEEENAERMTKSTFLCQITHHQGRKTITLREITYSKTLQQSVVDKQYFIE